MNWEFLITETNLNFDFLLYSFYFFLNVYFLKTKRGEHLTMFVVIFLHFLHNSVWFMVYYLHNFIYA